MDARVTLIIRSVIWRQRERLERIAGLSPGGHITAAFRLKDEWLYGRDVGDIQSHVAAVDMRSAAGDLHSGYGMLNMGIPYPVL